MNFLGIANYLDFDSLLDHLLDLIEEMLECLLDFSLGDECDEDKDEVLLGLLLVLENLRRGTSRKRSQKYMLRSSLLHPRFEVTVWRRVYNNRVHDVIGFSSFTRLPPNLFEVMEKHFQGFYNESPIYGYEEGVQLSKRQLSSPDCLGLALCYLRSKGEGRDIATLFGLTFSTMSKYLWFCLHCLVKALSKIGEAKIVFPSEEKIKEFGEVIKNRYHLLSGIYGFLDGIFLIGFLKSYLSLF
jgi:hypothetical protein